MRDMVLSFASRCRGSQGSRSRPERPPEPGTARDAVAPQPPWFPIGRATRHFPSAGYILYQIERPDTAKQEAVIAQPIDDETFSTIVRFAPLVSIDLIIRDNAQAILLGLRRNEPAKDFYFVPGGVIRKNETLRDAFARILRTETGQLNSSDKAHFLGAYEHFYSTNRYGDPTYGTHYICLAYEVPVGQRPVITLDDQHHSIRWMTEADLLAAADVHPNTKAYFR